jgi:ketosteroid isomerase-like protein
MKRFREVVAAAVLLFAGCATTRPAPASPALQSEIRQALQRWNEANGRGDLAAVMAQFDDAPDLLLVGSDRGEIFQGREAIQGWLAKLFVRNRFGWEMDRVEIAASGDAAWVFVEGSIVVKDLAGGLRVRRPYRFTGVLVRRGEGWAWRLFDGSVPAAD